MGPARRRSATPGQSPSPRSNDCSCSSSRAGLGWRAVRVRRSAGLQPGACSVVASSNQGSYLSGRSTEQRHGRDRPGPTGGSLARGVSASRSSWLTSQSSANRSPSASTNSTPHRSPAPSWTTRASKRHRLPVSSPPARVGPQSNTPRPDPPAAGQGPRAKRSPAPDPCFSSIAGAQKRYGALCAWPIADARSS